MDTPTVTHPDVLATNDALATWEDADSAYHHAIYQNASADQIHALDRARKRAASAWYQALATAIDATS